MTRTPNRRLLALALTTALYPAVVLPAMAQSAGQTLPSPFSPDYSGPATSPAPAPSSSATGFTVSDIRVDGLQRIAAGTVFTYLPVERGDVLDQASAGEAIRRLYKTGFFEDISLSRQGSILVVTVKERPAINKLELKGNKDIETEQLMAGLNDIGLSEGNTFDRLALDRVTQELTRQYNNRGKYNVEITPSVVQLDRNRVDLTIDVKEGKAAKIRHVNLIGNDSFEQKDILETWESRESNWLSWYRRDDQYSREKFSGDLEKLNSWYLDRGYVDVSIDSPQVSISGDRQDMFITAGLTEGEKYTVSSVEVTGDTVLPKDQIERLVLVQPEQTFSRRLLEVSSDSITATLGNVGYAFAQVNTIPDINREDKTVGINLQVVPGPRVNVRHVVFKGNTRTGDEVLRREMRQFEGAWYSQAAIDRSKIRLQGLGFFETVDVDTQPVPGSNDQVDVIYELKETTSGSFVFGLGFSQLGGLSAQVQLSQNNFLGTGNRMSVQAQRSDYFQSYDFSYVNPYFSDNGMSLGYNLWWRDYDYGEFNTAQYNSANGAAQAVFGIPITETGSITGLFGIDKNTITAYRGQTPEPIVDYIDAIGQRTFHAWRGEIGWARNTLNNALTPTVGTTQRLWLEATLPGSTVEYFKINYNISKYWPVTRWLVFNTRGELGYGDAYQDPVVRNICYTAGSAQDTDGDGIPDTYVPGPDPSVPCETTSPDYYETLTADGLPFFENFYAGGVRSVRGFRDNTLGPREAPFDGSTYTQPVGGALKTVGSFEMIFPTLFDSPGARISSFIDFGNVFKDVDSFDAGELRGSAGIALLWRSPMGPISISYAYPFQKEDDDEIERLQFTFGGAF